MRTLAGSATEFRVVGVVTRFVRLPPVRDRGARAIMWFVEERRQLDPQQSGYPGPERRRVRSRRFLDRYERRRDERRRGEHHSLVRPFRVGGGILLIVAGIAIGWLPGPGFVIFALPGAFLIASEIRRMALVMDRMENETFPRVLRAWARVRGGPKDHWVEQDPALWNDWTDRQALGSASDELDFDSTSR